MKTLEKLRQRIIALIHGLPYEEAIKKEPAWCNDENDKGYNLPIITIGRVMAALNKLKNVHSFYYNEKIYISDDFSEESTETYANRMDFGIIEIIDFPSVKTNGQECTLEDQSKETIESLYKLLK